MISAAHGRAARGVRRGEEEGAEEGEDEDEGDGWGGGRGPRPVGGWGGVCSASSLLHPPPHSGAGVIESGCMLRVRMREVAAC